MPIFEFKQLKQIALIETPVSGFKTTDKCLLFIILYLIIFKFFIKKIGKKLLAPKGPILLISLINLLLTAEEDKRKSYLSKFSLLEFFF